MSIIKKGCYRELPYLTLLLCVMLLILSLLGLVVNSTAQSSGSPSEAIQKLQLFLQQHGYDPGPVNGIITPKTLSAIDKYTHHASTGDRVAQYHVGTLYAQGIGVARDTMKATDWFRKAAEQGLNEAQYELGLMYARGEGVSQDFIRAYAWHYVAAQGGNHRANRNLGHFEQRLTLSQRQQALAFGKKLFEVCGTSKAQ